MSVAASGAGERVLRFFAAALGPVSVVIVAVVVQTVMHGLPPLVVALCVALGAGGVYWLHTRYLERRLPVELAPAGLPWFAGGVLGGIALIALVMFSLALLGAYHLQGPSPVPVDLAAAAAGALATAVVEEVLFRGYLFRWIAGWNAWAAIGITSLVFGFAHAANPHATPFSSAAIAAEAGLLLGAAFWLSGNLWFPIGIHLGWNFAEGTIFSTPVSGSAAPGLILGTLSGPVALTGGAFGLEASVVALGTCTTAGIVLLVACAVRHVTPVR